MSVTANYTDVSDGRAHRATTNRPTKQGFFPPPGSESPLFDTIRVRGAVEEACLPQWRSKGRCNSVTGEVLEDQVTGEYGLVTGKVWVNVRKLNGIKVGIMEFSPATVLRGVNLDPSSAEEVWQVVDLCYRLATRYVRWSSPVGKLEVTRLDVVRTFQPVPDLPVLLAALSLIPGSRLGFDKPYRNPKTGSMETLVRGAHPTWTARMYDKHAQLINLAARATTTQRPTIMDAAEQAVGTARYEAQLRRPLLQNMGVRVMDDIANSESRIAAKARDLFERCRYGSEVGGISKVIDAVRRMRSTPADYKRVERMLGQLLLNAYGEPLSSKDEKTIREHRRLAEKYGLNPADLRNSDRPPIRLDYDLARQVGG